jgi:hypothetical protein
VFPEYVQPLYRYVPADPSHTELGLPSDPFAQEGLSGAAGAEVPQRRAGWGGGVFRGAGMVGEEYACTTAPAAINRYRLEWSERIRSWRIPANTPYAWRSHERRRRSQQFTSSKAARDTYRGNDKGTRGLLPALPPRHPHVAREMYPVRSPIAIEDIQVRLCHSS